MKTKDRAYDEIVKLSKLDPAVLDDLVHDVFSRRASKINNQGVHEQIAFLLYEGIFDNTDEILSFVNQSEV